MTSIQVKIIMPRNNQLFDIPAVKRIIKNTGEGISKDIKVDLDATTATWSNRPTAAIKSRGESTWDISISDDRYSWLNDGTKVRYATMTPGFQAKTVPRLLASRAGAGGVMFVNKSRPRPGIKARQWDDEVATKWQKLLPNVLERAILSEL